jgi:hypothetical protein
MLLRWGWRREAGRSLMLLPSGLRREAGRFVMLLRSGARREAGRFLMLLRSGLRREAGRFVMLLRSGLRCEAGRFLMLLRSGLRCEADRFLMLLQLPDLSLRRVGLPRECDRLPARRAGGVGVDGGRLAASLHTSRTEHTGHIRLYALATATEMCAKSNGRGWRDW